MVRFVRLLAAAALAAGLATPAAHAQTSGPLEQAAPMRAAKPHETTMKKRAKRPAHVGRDVTVHARHRPSYLTAGTQAPVGTVGNGYVWTRSTSRPRSRGPSPACADGRGSPTSSATPRRPGCCSSSDLSVARARLRGADRAAETRPRPRPRIPADRASRAPSERTRVSIASPWPRLWWMTTRRSGSRIR